MKIIFNNLYANYRKKTHFIQNYSTKNISNFIIIDTFNYKHMHMHMICYGGRICFNTLWLLESISLVNILYKSTNELIWVYVFCMCMRVCMLVNKWMHMCIHVFMYGWVLYSRIYQANMHNLRIIPRDKRSRKLSNFLQICKLTSSIPIWLLYLVICLHVHWAWLGELLGAWLGVRFVAWLGMGFGRD